MVELFTKLAVNRLKDRFRLSETMVSRSLKLAFNLLTVLLVIKIG